MIGTVLMILLIALLPWAAMKLAKKVPFLAKLGSVFLCYALGLILSFPLKAMGSDLVLASDVSSVLVCVAMPLILFSANLPALRKLAKPMLGSFALNAVSVLAVAVVFFFLFRGLLPDAAKISAMLIGTYTGGTPNMFAIGHGLGAGADRILLTQTADLIGGGIYFFLLISVLPPLLKKWLPEYRMSGLQQGADSADLYGQKGAKVPFRNYPGIVLLALACALAAMGLCLLLPSKYGNSGLAKLSEYTAVIMLLVTSFGIALSFVKKVRSAPGSYQAGQYCILMFSAAMGMCFDVSTISGSVLLIFLMLLAIQFGTVILHFLLAKAARIDYHTAMITSTAGVFGPAFIIPVAGKLKNDEIILPGILCGILGYAAGNYLGIGVGQLLMLLG